MKIEFNCKKENDKLIMDNKKVFNDFINSLQDGDYTMCITRNIDKRSINQNNYYQGVCLPIILRGLQDVGYVEVKTKEDANQFVKYIIGVEETSKLNSIEFNEFLEKIAHWASSFLGVVIPSQKDGINEII